MKTIQMTIDEPLLEEVDQTIKSLNTNRSAFIREALEYALHRIKVRQMEIQQVEGYSKFPVESGEFDVWLEEQAWNSV